MPHITHPEKIMYPAVGFTKRDVGDYYHAVAKVLVPHLRGRPITLKRYPNGVNGPFFYERHCPSYRPEFVDTANVHSTTYKEGVEHCVLNDERGLIWAANLGSLELHILLSSADHVDRPTQIIFDLDPGPPAGHLECARVAFHLKTLFDSLKLKAFIKTSGGKGIHFVVPLNTPANYDQTKNFAHSVAMLMEKNHPDLVVSKMQKALRPGKVLVDWSQNDNHKSTVAPYSLRAQQRPTVSTPITWDELKAFVKKGKKGSLTYEAKDLPARLKKVGDLFSPVIKLKQKLPRLGSMQDAS